MKVIVFTGGGTAGHVTPNLALLRRLDRSEWEIHYIGTADGIEQKLIAKEEGVYYHSVAWGKLRRYFSWRNFTDPFRVVKGFAQSKRILKTIKPDVLFSKGGFVSVPVVMAAKGVCPVIAHESDYTPGLANRIASRYADTVCVTFEDTLKTLKKGKGVFTGTPIRAQLLQGNRERGLAFTGLSGKKPVLIVMGGSSGAKAVNELVRIALPTLTETFDVVHLCGKGLKDDSLTQTGYVQYEYVDSELPDLMALADIAVSRAGANAVFEYLAVGLPALLIPLPLSQSRGDQIQNAEYFARKGFAVHYPQDEATPEGLTAAARKLYSERERYKAAMAAEPQRDGTDAILSLLVKAAKA